MLYTLLFLLIILLMPTQHPFINKRNIYSVKCTCMNRDYILSSNNTCMYIFSSCKNLTNLLKWYKNTNNKNKLIKLNKITTKSIHVQLQHVILNGRNMKKALDKFTSVLSKLCPLTLF